MCTFAWGCLTFRDYDIEIEGLKRETLKAQEEHEGLIAVRDRLESGRAFVEEQLAKTKVWRFSQRFTREGSFFPLRCRVMGSSPGP